MHAILGVVIFPYVADGLTGYLMDFHVISHHFTKFRLDHSNCMRTRTKPPLTERYDPSGCPPLFLFL